MTTYFRVLTHDGLIREAATPFGFPAGERHLKEVTDYRGEGVWIADVRFAGGDDLTHAHLFADVAHQRQQPFVLMLPYLPAARADRGEPNGAAVYAQKVQAMNPQQVIAVDPHSRFVVDYYDRIMPGKLTVLDGFDLIVRALREAGDLDSYDAIIAPDKGAHARAMFVAEHLGFDCYQAEKHRDPESETGRILSIEMTEKLPAAGKYLVVDDICDAGGTFIGLAKATGLSKDQLGLWATHYTGNGGAIRLRDYYGCIMTTDSHAGHNAFADRFTGDIFNTSVHVTDVVMPCETYMVQNLKEFWNEPGWFDESAVIGEIARQFFEGSGL